MTPTLTCRVCDAPEPRLSGRIRPYLDYECDVFDCDACGSRFAPHDPTAHESLHASPTSSYGAHRAVGDALARMYEQGDVDRMRRHLSARPKQAFVIDSVAASAVSSSGCRVLDVGCSTGYLTAYFLAAGYDAIGMDISRSAIEMATARFGPHFHLPDAPEVSEREPFDVVYHVGTVGCVDNPEAFTRSLIAKLRPGGVLLFNAPNADVARHRGLVWGVPTPPPDLVTLFTASYWHRFADIATVNVEVTTVSPSNDLARRLRRMRQRDPQPTHAILNQPPGAPPRATPSTLRRLVELAAQVGSQLGIVRPTPAEYGLHVTMRRRD